MILSPRKLLKQFLSENPGLSDEEACSAFLEFVASRPPIQKAILEEVFDERGPDRLARLLDEKKAPTMKA